MRVRIVHVRKHGNSLGINFPVDVVKRLGVRAGDAVSLAVKPGLVIIARLAVEELERALAEQAAAKTAT